MSCDPVRMCLGGGGGYEQFASLWGYLVALAAVGVVAISEELFARGYVIGELLPSLQHYGSRRLRLGGVLLSGATFLLMHAFVLGPIWGYFPSTQWYAIQILAGGLTYATVYIYTKRNLALTILMHFYYDAYAPLLSSSSLSAVFLLVTIFPAIIVLAHHFQLAKTRRTELNLGLESPVMNKALSASAA